MAYDKSLIIRGIPADILSDLQGNLLRVLQLTRVDQGRNMPAPLAEVCRDAILVIRAGCAAIDELEQCPLQADDCESHWLLPEDLATLSPRIWALNVLNFAESLEFRDATLERA